ncbi:ABC transporter permease, partial [Streptomyces sp. T-3]|nr:ABC transporter permease [Streptomyces sp. T-3]
GLARTLDPGVEQGSLDGLRPGTVSVGRDRAASLGLSLGSTVRLRFGDGVEAPLEVVAIHERALAVGDFVLSRSQLARHVAAPGAAQVLIATEPGAAVSAVRDRVGRTLGVPVSERPSFPRLRVEGEEMSALLGLLAVAAIGGFTALAVLSTLRLITIGRRAELRLLRLVGAGRSQLRRMLRAEAAVVAFTGLVVGAVVAVVPLLAFSIALAGTAPYLPLVQGGAIVGVVAVTAYAGVLVPARRVLRRV